MRLHFISENEEYFKSAVFGKILLFVNQHPKTCRMKDTSGKLLLTLEDILSVDDAFKGFTTTYALTLRSRREMLSRYGSKPAELLNALIIKIFLYRGE